MIISASRRTDIPAFYARWFINRIREEFLLVRNPFNAKQVRRVNLSPEAVDVIVFWTRNPRPLMPYLRELDDRGYKYYFQFTITGFPRDLEKSTPSPHRAIQTFTELSELIGKRKVIWRFDPILINSLVDENEHIRLFSKIARLLESHCDRVVISFADLYKKVQRNLDKVLHRKFDYVDIVSEKDRLFALAAQIQRVALEHGLEIQSCAEEMDLEEVGISRGKCIDDRLIRDVFGIEVDHSKDKGQRTACGCVKSIDIGQYNTCAHGCAYCYATYNNALVARNKRLHDERSPFLVGSPDDLAPEAVSQLLMDRQGSLFE